MIKILATGMNHETAPVELRECLATNPHGIQAALAFMRDAPAFREGMFISTCNRVEALVVTEDKDQAKKSIVSLFSRLGGKSGTEFQHALYHYEDQEAIRHIFRVSSSLDSMVVGEPQILGQIKEAYREAVRGKTSGVVLNRLMHKAFHVAKRVRSETGVCEAAVSIAYAAVELAKKIFYGLEKKRVMLIGAGDMAELAARHFLGQGVEGIVVSNRTFERAVEMAQEFRGEAVSFEEIPAQLGVVDIVLSSTASPDFVITREMVKGALKRRRNRPLFFIDIAVPRDVEPRVNDLDNVYVYDIDDLRGVVELNLAQRREEAVRAERIVQEEVVKFQRWLETLDVVPTIVSLREKADRIIETELRRSASALQSLTPEQREAINILTRSIADKLLHDPIVFLKNKAGKPMLENYLDVTRRLFNLDDNNND